MFREGRPGIDAARFPAHTPRMAKKISGAKSSTEVEPVAL
jgi:hypothetical protein